MEKIHLLALLHWSPRGSFKGSLISRWNHDNVAMDSLPVWDIFFLKVRKLFPPKITPPALLMGNSRWLERHLWAQCQQNRSVPGGINLIRRFSINSGFPVASGQHENDGLMVLNRLSLKIHLTAVRFVLISLCHYIFRLLLPDIRQNLWNDESKQLHKSTFPNTRLYISRQVI